MYSSESAGSRSWQSASLPGQRRDVERAFALHQLARLASGVARPRRQHRLLDDLLGLARMLFQEPAQALVDHALDDALHLRGDQLVLGLVAELRIRVLDRDHGRQPLADVVAAEPVLEILEQPGGLRIGVDRAGQGRAETGEVRAAVLVLDVVGEAEDRVLVRVVPLQSDFDLGSVLLALDRRSACRAPAPWRLFRSATNWRRSRRRT